MTGGRPGLLLAVVLLTLGMVYLTVLLNQ